MMRQNKVYLDYNATGIVRPKVIDGIVEALGIQANASSVHKFGFAAKKLIEKSRNDLADFIKAEPKDIFFTSGGTESNVSVINSYKRKLIISSIEHESVFETAKNIGINTEIIPVDKNGIINLDFLDKILQDNKEPSLVSIMLANNETGIIQPISEAAKIIKYHGSLLHCDAVQALGKIKVDVQKLGAQILSFSAHKIGGPQGVGAIWVKNGVKLNSLLTGGAQENFKRAGTENISGIHGFACAINDISFDEMHKLKSLRSKLEDKLTNIAPINIYSYDKDRLPNTTCFSISGISREAQLIALDLDGIAVSSGSACSSGKIAHSHVLKAMGASEKDLDSAIRVSSGWNTNNSDIEKFIDSWSKIYFNNNLKNKIYENN